ncbi:MAG: MBL fold metallo-hydrolase [Zoogloeaceae bacterium]|nr:MBL fold metallo-hydrolase [Zoogloeaceae bacterium]
MKSARHLLLALGLGVISFLSTSFLPDQFARAEAPQVKTQAPGFYRLMLGAFEITALFDGVFDLDASLLDNVYPEGILTQLARHFNLRNGKFQTAVNGYLVNTGEKLVLVDAGTGGGATTGRLIANLRAAGYTPEQVDAVLLTHLHGDHAGGLLDAEGKAVFPNATVHASAAEAEFWLAEDAVQRAIAAKQVPRAAPAAQLPAYFENAARLLAPYRAAGRFRTVADGVEIFPGIEIVAAHGHTPGHSGFRVTSAGERLLIWGDIVHSAAVQFARPEVAIAFDASQKTAIATRRAVFARAAREKILVGGMHLPFPGLGHVVVQGKDSYAWIPVDYTPLKD